MTDRTETIRALVVVTGFAVALGGTTVIYPLLALDVGYSAAAVGVFTSVSAAAQLLTRFCLPWLLAKVADRRLIGAACLMLALSAGVLFLTGSLAAFLVAQTLQGSARAFFWTSSQSHMVRASGSAVQRLAQVGIASKLGALIGPTVAGSIAVISLTAGLWVTMVGGIVPAFATLLMAHRPPYQREARAQRKAMWRRRELMSGYWTAFTSGGWRGILDSYVPVVLAAAGFGAAPIGWLASTAEGAHLLTSSWLARAPQVRLLLLVRLSALGVLAGVAILPLSGMLPGAAVVALILGGVGSGLSTTVGPAIATEHAPDGEQGTVLALTGAYRSAARMVTPSAIGGMGSLVGIPAALVVVTVGIVAPSLSSSWRERRAPDGAGSAP